MRAAIEMHPHDLGVLTCHAEKLVALAGATNVGAEMDLSRLMCIA
jgi:hypothetical protein